jgi:hypothetical protein
MRCGPSAVPAIGGGSPGGPGGHRGQSPPVLAVVVAVPMVATWSNEVRALGGPRLASSGGGPAAHYYGRRKFWPFPGLLARTMQYIILGGFSPLRPRLLPLKLRRSPEIYL